MFLLGLEKATVEMPSKVVLNDVSLGVNEGDRIGIVGRNGDGKSTLLKLLSGQLLPNDGRVIRTNGITVGYLGQTDALGNVDVKTAVVGDAPEYEWASDPKVRAIISGLLSDIDWEGSVQALSGGQRRRVDLARVLVGKWDVVMLDEPTNHLDMKAIAFLSEHLKTRWKKGEGALLTVTHDRWFLDEVCNSMWEVHDGRVELFEGGFSAYIMQRVERERQAAVAEQKRQNRLRRELAWLSRGARARSTKPKFHVAAAKELIADVPELRDSIELKRMAIARIGKTVVELEDVSVSYPAPSDAQAQDPEELPSTAILEDASHEDDKQVLNDITWIIGPGDRFGIVGGNGAGKTTLLNVIQGKLEPTSGKIKIGATVKFAILSQHLDSLYEFQDDRVRQIISRYSHKVMLDGKEATPSQLLEKLGFEKADLNEYVRDLSGGQARRLALMMILLEEPNVLILDEPGNDLDVDMLAALEDMLDGWPGTLLLVTHDRFLMERVTDKQFALMDGTIRHLPGGIDEYLKLEAQREEAAAADVSSSANQGASLVDEPVEAASSADASQADVATLPNSEIRRLKKFMSSNEKKMDTLQGKIDDAKEAMHNIDPTDYQSLSNAQAEIDEMTLRLDELEMEWLDAAAQLEGN